MSWFIMVRDRVHAIHNICTNTVYYGSGKVGWLFMDERTDCVIVALISKYSIDKWLIILFGLRSVLSIIVLQRFNLLFCVQDGRQEPRGGHTSRVLPNPRWMSQRNHPDEDLPDTRYTHMVMQFGQFLDHDMTLTPKDGISC